MVKKKAVDEKVKKQPVSFFPWQWGLIAIKRNEWGETISGVVRRMMHEWDEMQILLNELFVVGLLSQKWGMSRSDCLRRIVAEWWMIQEQRANEVENDPPMQ